MHVEGRYALKRYNTFSIDAYAEHFLSFDSLDSLREGVAYARENSMPVFVLGGGSNVLFMQDFKGFVLHNNMQGISQAGEDNDYVYLKVSGGVGWHDFVEYAIARGLGGVENLSLIPGRVGASPIQNIGAYGVELKDSFYELEALQLETLEQRTFSKNDCAFGYRDSVFKRALKNKYVITTVTFQLRKIPVLQTTYGAIQAELARLSITNPGIREISNAIINIRRSKLPDPAKIGNAGSFFKNPEVDRKVFENLESNYPQIPGYPAQDSVKLAAGWLIEQCGWKGYRHGDAGCHVNQALVLVNYGNASGADIYELSTMIVESVKEKFGVVLEREVNIV